MRYLIILLFPITLFSQVTETKIAGQNAIVWTPKLETGKKYKTIVFYQGAVEAGADAKLMLKNGMGVFLKNGTLKPDNAICIALQQTTAWVLATTYEKTLQEIYKLYPVDSFCLTGLSAGGFAIWNYLQAKTSSLPICSAVIMSFGVTDYANYNPKGFKGIRSWVLCGKSDERFNTTKGAADKVASAGYSVRTTWYDGGHSGWNTYYNPTWKENGQSIYDFMIGTAKVTAPIPPPVVVPAPTPKTYKPGDTLKLKILEINDSVLILKTLY